MEDEKKKCELVDMFCTNEPYRAIWFKLDDDSRLVFIGHVCETHDIHIDAYHMLYGNTYYDLHKPSRWLDPTKVIHVSESEIIYDGRRLYAQDFLHVAKPGADKIRFGSPVDYLRRLLKRK